MSAAQKVLLAVALLALAPAAVAKSKVALVIGNGAYQYSSNLANPTRDARAIGDTLSELGFDVIRKENLGLGALVDELDRFTAQARQADDAILYFAGHGIESGGENYVLPVDAKLARESRLRYETVPLSQLMDTVGGARRLQLVILDACRNNPLANTMQRSDGKRSSFRGLARPGERSNTLVAYATRDGSVAADGQGGNSPFASALIEAFNTPGLEIGFLFRRVRDRVLNLTNNAQEPWLYGTLGGDPIYLRPGSEPAIANKPDASALDLAYWQGALALGTKSAFEDYLRKYPKGQFADQADMQIAALGSGPSGRRPQPTARPRLHGLAGKIPGEVFMDCADCPEMVRLPTDSFLMGSNEGDADEKPVHTVNINYPLAVGKYEVTKGQFRAFVEATGRSVGECQYYDSVAKEYKIDKGRYWHNVPEQKTEDFPVSCVNFDDARAYAQWLSRKTGKTYRLLSEAEWEYAARGGTRTTYPWGSDGDAHCAYANGADQTAKEKNSGWKVSSCRDGYAASAPVGSFRGNGYGLYDMIGNVWEWTQDCWNGSYSGAPVDGAAWTGGDCTRRVLRGGSWNDDPRYQRSAYRAWYTASDRNLNFGFRLARAD